VSFSSSSSDESSEDIQSVPMPVCTFVSKISQTRCTNPAQGERRMCVRHDQQICVHMRVKNRCQKCSAGNQPERVVEPDEHDEHVNYCIFVSNKDEECHSAAGENGYSCKTHERYFCKHKIKKLDCKECNAPEKRKSPDPSVSPNVNMHPGEPLRCRYVDESNVRCANYVRDSLMYACSISHSGLICDHGMTARLCGECALVKRAKTSSQPGQKTVPAVAPHHLYALKSSAPARMIQTTRMELPRMPTSATVNTKVVPPKQAPVQLYPVQSPKQAPIRTPVTPPTWIPVQPYHVPASEMSPATDPSRIFPDEQTARNFYVWEAGHLWLYISYLQRQLFDRDQEIFRLRSNQQ
jgi:hypothetical protein